MFQRKLVFELAKRLSEPRRFIQIITGPRQTGKTTAVLQCLKVVDSPHHFASADDPLSHSPQWLQNEWQYARSLAKNGTAILVIDEIQKIPDWSAIVKQLWDEDYRLGLPLKVVLSGSSTLLLQKGLSESLLGRYEVLYSTHWTFSECREAFNFSLDDFLLFGGYPGAATLIDDEERWARYIGESIIEPTITQDILMMEEVRKPALLRALCMLGFHYSAQELSYTKLLGQLQDAGNTVTLAHYLELLSKANILTGLQKYSGKAIKRKNTSPRFMVYDTSFLSFIEGAGRRELLEDPRAKGHLVESAVGARLLAQSREENFEVFWWRERSSEVDFVIKKGLKISAIEVKSGRIKNLGGSLEFKKKYPEAFSIVIGSNNFPLESFLLGEIELFL